MQNYSKYWVILKFFKTADPNYIIGFVWVLLYLILKPNRTEKGKPNCYIRFYKIRKLNQTGKNLTELNFFRFRFVLPTPTVT